MKSLISKLKNSIMFVSTIMLLIVALIAFGSSRYVNAEESEGLVSVEQKNTDSNAEKTDGDEPDSEGDLGNVDTPGNSGESQGGNTLESGSNEEGSENPGDDPKGKSGSEPGTGGGENSEDAASDDESGNSLDEALDDEDLVCICLEECTRASHNVTENDNQTVDGDSEDMTVDGDNEDSQASGVGEATKADSDVDSDSDSDAADFVNQDCPLCMRDYTKCQFEANRLALQPTVATVKTFVIDEDEESETYQSIIEAFVEFKSLNTAFDALPAIVDDVRSLGQEYESYYPTVVLNSDISELTTLDLSSSCDLWIDLHGVSLSFAENEGIFIGSNNITVEDSAYTGISESGELIPRGSITCNSDAMFSGTGSIIIINGHFNNESGVIFAKDDSEQGGSESEEAEEADEAGFEPEPEPTATIFDDVLRVIITDGFFATGGSYILGAEVEYRVFNGAFSFKPATRYPVSFQAGGSFLLPDGRILKPTEVRIGENLVECFEPVEASFEAFLEEASEREIYYFFDFNIATKVAMEISIENDGAKCVIEETENNIESVVLEKSMMITTDGAINPCIEFKDMSFERDPSFSGAMFIVLQGELTLNDCEADLRLLDETPAASSGIIVGDKATLNLIGSADAGTIISHNLSPVSEEDPGAGIWLQNGGSLRLLGNVRVLDNSNLYSVGGSSILCRVGCNIFFTNDVINPSRLVLLGETGSESVNSLIAGITLKNELCEDTEALGGLQDSYYTALLNRFKDAELIDIDAMLDQFFMDASPSHHVRFDALNNKLIWDYKAAYLPAAGVYRWEIVLLMVGFFGLIVRTICIRHKKTGLRRYISFVSTLCLTLGTMIGIVNINTELAAALKNSEIVKAMSSLVLKDADALEPVDEFVIVEELLITDTKESSDMTLEHEKVLEIPDSKEALSVFPMDSREYYCIIEIPEIGIKLPVIAAYSDTDMKISPCVYSGALESDDLVIVGHNYDSQFGKLNENRSELTVKLTLADGTIENYRSVSWEELEPGDVKKMITGDWDLTVFTCTRLETKRLAIRFERE